LFERVTIRVSVREASERFYDLVLATIGVAKTVNEPGRTAWSDFVLCEALEGERVTRRVHLGFGASRKDVDAFWRAGTAAGYRDDGEPGLRPEYGPDYYGGFLLDPDGNSAEAVHHGSVRRGGAIDHLWIRVADVAASRRFYELVGRHAGFPLRSEPPGRAQFSAGNGSFSVVDGEPTEGLEMAFPAEAAAVDTFHSEALAAGYADNGAPGPGPGRSRTGYAAFVLDPDGNEVGLVARG
jgi:catechol 2,3-dioxygenase-like lactoylglutathione lyase family enzyme